MRYFLVIAVSFLVVFVAACSKTQPWERSEISGYNFRLDSKSEVRSYSFADTGAVDVESGGSGGPASKRALVWEIGDNGVLVIKESSNKDAKVIAKVVKLGQDGDRYKVSTASGREFTYIRTKLP